MEGEQGSKVLGWPEAALPASFPLSNSHAVTGRLLLPCSTPRPPFTSNRLHKARIMQSENRCLYALGSQPLALPLWVTPSICTCGDPSLSPQVCPPFSYHWR